MENRTAKEWVEEGMKYYHTDFEKGIACFSRAAAIVPFERDGWYWRGRKHLSADKYEEALADFSVVLRLMPDDDNSTHFLGVSHFYLGEYDAAAECFRKSLRLMQKKGVELIPPAVDWIWMACMRKGDPEAAKAVLDEYIYPDIPCEASDEDYRKRVLLYAGYMTPEEFEASVPADADDSTGITLYYGLANYCRFVLKDEKRFKKVLEKVLAYPTMHHCHAYKLALKDYKGLREENKIIELEAAVAGDPSNAEAWDELGMQYFDTDFDKARRCFSRAVAIAPFNAKYVFHRGWKALSADCYEEALADCRLSVRLDPEDGFKWHYVANALFFLGEIEAAEEAYREALNGYIRRGMDLIPAAVDWIWMCCMIQGKTEAAEAVLKQYITPDVPIETDDYPYKKRVLLYAGYTDIDTYMKDITMDNGVDQITELYAAANYYRYIDRNPAEVDRLMDAILAIPNDHHAFGYKSALKYKKERA